jgi:FkbM family methyltransferase
VVAIEASPETFRLLEHNVSINSASNIRALNVAASDRAGELTFYVGTRSNVGGTSVFARKEPADVFSVGAARLCDLLSPQEIAHIRLIKIDAEGAEVAVLQGLLPCMSKTRHDLEIVVEVGGGPLGSPTAFESSSRIMDMFADMGFFAYALESNYLPEAYLARGRPGRPHRIREPLQAEGDMILSRIDADGL